jgi:hypothetical protein
MPCVTVARMGVLEMRYGLKREKVSEREEDGTNIKSSSER